MSRSLFALTASAFVAVACGSTTPTLLVCPTKAQSLTFTAAGSCSGGGGGTKKVTISTQPGLCNIYVEGGNEVNIPTEGQFLGTAVNTGYDLSKGNWSLTVNHGNAADGSTSLTCDESIDSNRIITVSCSGTICPPDDGNGAQCSTIDCAEHLTPVK